MLDRLAALQRRGLVDDLDLHFARLVARLDAGAHEAVLLGALLASRATSEGHVCIALERVAGSVLFAAEDAAPVSAPELPAWREALRASAAVAAPGGRAPLVLDAADRLYLYRYWDSERRLAADLVRRAAWCPPDDDGDAALGTALERLFGPPPGSIDWQRVAAAVAALRGLCVVSGGPGTGKTTTVARLLALLVERHAGARPPRIALAAPTGKAAARLQAALRDAAPGLATTDAVRAALPDSARTLHRLLGMRPGGGFRHGPDDPLPYDVLVVDEASMVDLVLMTRLLEALPPTCRLVLLGDRDQLASVEAGAVLGALCAGRDAFSASFAARLAPLVGTRLPDVLAVAPALQDAVVVLRDSYRFGHDSAIGRLAAAINAGDGAGALALLADPRRPAVGHADNDDREAFAAALERRAESGFGPYLDALAEGAPADDLLAMLEQFRLLCAHRRGPRGVAEVNDLVEAWARRRGGVPAGVEWYPGRPVLVTGNDYTTGLFNGDVGLTLPAAGDPRDLRVVFAGSDGEVRRIAPSRLPAHATAFALSIHRSQGSEYDRVVLVLPERDSPVLTRELLYTAVTRARVQVEIDGAVNLLLHAVARPLERDSGLAERLAEG